MYVESSHSRFSYSRIQCPLPSWLVHHRIMKGGKKLKIVRRQVGRSKICWNSFIFKVIDELEHIDEEIKSRKKDGSLTEWRWIKKVRVFLVSFYFTSFFFFFWNVTLDLRFEEGERKTGSSKRHEFWHCDLNIEIKYVHRKTFSFRSTLDNFSARRKWFIFAPRILSLMASVFVVVLRKLKLLIGHCNMFIGVWVQL